MSIEEKYRIMTYNVRNNFDPPPDSWEERKKLVGKILDREMPDMLATQECSYRLVCDLHAIMQGYDWIGMGREGGSKDEFVAIFYKKDRFEVKEYNHFWLSATPNVIGSVTWGHVIPRMATWIRFRDRKTNRQFYHINTHLDHQSSEAREKSARLIRDKATTFDTELPIILTGDFNTGTDSGPYKLLVNEGGFTDTWNTAERNVNKALGTFNNFKDGTGGKVRIDWILIRGKASVKMIKIADDTYDGQFPSDHFPVIVDLILQ